MEMIRIVSEYLISYNCVEGTRERTTLKAKHKYKINATP